MSSCKELAAALAALSAKIDSLNSQVSGLKGELAGLRQQIDAIGNKVNALESQANNFNSRITKLETDKGLGNQNNNPTDLTPIYQRLSKIESYINKFDAAVSQTIAPLKELATLLLNFLL